MDNEKTFMFTDFGPFSDLRAAFLEPLETSKWFVNHKILVQDLWVPILFLTLQSVPAPDVAHSDVLVIIELAVLNVIHCSIASLEMSNTVVQHSKELQEHQY